MWAWAVGERRGRREERAAWALVGLAGPGGELDCGEPRELAFGRIRGGLLLFFFYFLFQSLFPTRILNAIKFKPKVNSTKLNMLQHECLNKFLSLCWILISTKIYLFTNLNAHKNT